MQVSMQTVVYLQMIGIVVGCFVGFVIALGLIKVIERYREWAKWRRFDKRSARQFYEHQ